MSDEQIADFLAAHGTELGVDGIERQEILNPLAKGAAVLERRHYGVALIQPQVTPPDEEFFPYLQFLYINPEFRGQGYGTQFVRELLTTYSNTDNRMKIAVFGEKRIKFFTQFAVDFLETS